MRQQLELSNPSEIPIYQPNSIITCTIKSSGIRKGYSEINGQNIVISNAHNHVGDQCIVRMDSKPTSNLANLISPYSGEPINIGSGKYSLHAQVSFDYAPKNLRCVEQYYDPGSTGAAIYQNGDGLWFVHNRGATMHYQGNLEEVVTEGLLRAPQHPPFLLSNLPEVVDHFKEISKKHGLAPLEVQKINHK